MQIVFQSQQGSIMRRVYLTFFLKVMLHPVTIHLMLIATFFAVLTHFVSFPNVIGNLLNRSMGEMHTFLFESAASTEVWTLLLFGAIGVSLLSMCTHCFGLLRTETTEHNEYAAMA